MKPGLPTTDTSLEDSADYIPDLVKDRKVHFMFQDLEEENTALNTRDEEANDHDAEEHGDDSEESSLSEEQSFDDSDTGDTTDVSDISEDVTVVRDGSSKLRGGSPAPSPIGSGLNTDQLFQQFIEVGQCPSLKLSSLDQLTR